MSHRKVLLAKIRILTFPTSGHDRKIFSIRAIPTNPLPKTEHG
jgi:hypothetical protein